jgi:hypothetical protein
VWAAIACDVLGFLRSVETSISTSELRSRKRRRASVSAGRAQLSVLLLNGFPSERAFDVDRLLTAPIPFEGVVTLRGVAP